jgi:hypothetical protein
MLLYIQSRAVCLLVFLAANFLAISNGLFSSLPRALSLLLEQAVEFLRNVENPASASPAGSAGWALSITLQSACLAEVVTTFCNDGILVRPFADDACEGDIFQLLLVVIFIIARFVTPL